MHPNLQLRRIRNISELQIDTYSQSSDMAFLCVQFDSLSSPYLFASFRCFLNLKDVRTNRGAICQWHIVDQRKSETSPYMFLEFCRSVDRSTGEIGAKEPLEVESEQETRRQRIKNHLIKLENIAMKDSCAENDIMDLLKKYVSMAQEDAGHAANEIDFFIPISYCLNFIN